MELFIQIRDGKPYEHPIFGDNFREAFPHIDVDNLPPDFARFTRIPKPEFRVQDFKVVGDEPTYEWGDGVVQDVWSVRDMTELEKQEALAAAAKGAAELVAYMRERAIENLALQITDAGKAAWQAYIDLLETYKVADIFNPAIPAPPRLDENGNIMSLAAPGSAPDVIA